MVFFSCSFSAWSLESDSLKEDLLKLSEIFRKQRIEISLLVVSLEEQQQSWSTLNRLLSEREEKLVELQSELTSLQLSLSESEKHSSSLEIALSQAISHSEGLEISLKRARKSLTDYSRIVLRRQIITGVACLGAGIVIGVLIR